MFIFLNTMFLAVVYVLLIAFMLSKPGSETDGGADDDTDGRGGDGGWDDSDDLPPLDLPPGIFILPPDQDDPSLAKKPSSDEVFL